jgi:hypothetical protein
MPFLIRCHDKRDRRPIVIYDARLAGIHGGP